MKRTNSITSNHTTEEYQITCQSTHVIYAATCTIPGCGKQYVGKSSNSLNSRFRGHHYDIRYRKEKPEKKNNHTGNDYEITGINSERDKNKWLRLEEAWMLLLDTQEPHGLNIQFWPPCKSTNRKEGIANTQLELFPLTTSKFFIRISCKLNFLPGKASYNQKIW